MARSHLILYEGEESYLQELRKFQSRKKQSKKPNGNKRMNEMFYSESTKRTYNTG